MIYYMYMTATRKKICTTCNVKLNHYNWLYINYKHKTYICDECRINKSSNCVSYSKEYKSYFKKIYRKKIRLETINHYGGKCEVCLENNINYLTIDHINNDGNVDRKIKKLGSGYNFYLYLKKNNYPKNVRVLCFNHNCSTSCMKDYVNKNPIYYKYKVNLKNSIIEAYGGKCNFCHHSIREHLTIDHINGILTEEDKKHRSSGGLYRYLVKNNFPKDNYQLLCYNCNCAKGFFGYIKENNVK